MTTPSCISHWAASPAVGNCLPGRYTTSTGFPADNNWLMLSYKGLAQPSWLSPYSAVFLASMLPRVLVVFSVGLRHRSACLYFSLLSFKRIPYKSFVCAFLFQNLFLSGKERAPFKTSHKELWSYQKHVIDCRLWSQNASLWILSRSLSSELLTLHCAPCVSFKHLLMLLRVLCVNVLALLVVLHHFRMLSLPSNSEQSIWYFAMKV